MQEYIDRTEGLPTKKVEQTRQYEATFEFTTKDGQEVVRCAALAAPGAQLADDGGRAVAELGERGGRSCSPTLAGCGRLAAVAAQRGSRCRGGRCSGRRGGRYDKRAPMVRRRILLVGGDVVAAVLREYFHVCHADDYEVESIEYCDDALKSLLRRPVDMVLLLSLRAPWRTWPSLSSPALHIGSESAILFLKQLRALHNQVPVIVASVRSDAEADALRNGAFAFILKPVNLAELDSLVALALGANRQAPLGE